MPLKVCDRLCLNVIDTDIMILILHVKYTLSYRIVISQLPVQVSFAPHVPSLSGVTAETFDSHSDL